VPPTGWHDGPEYFEGHEGARDFWLGGEVKAMGATLIWVIEPRGGITPHYWCGSRNGKFWSEDFESAMWFVRKVDAETYMEDQNIFGIAVEHAWVGK